MHVSDIRDINIAQNKTIGEKCQRLIYLWMYSILFWYVSLVKAIVAPVTYRLVDGPANIEELIGVEHWREGEVQKSLGL